MMPLKSCPFCGTTPDKPWSGMVQCNTCKLVIPEHTWQSRSQSAEVRFAQVELMGRLNHGPCKIREVDDLGGKALEATEIRKDGKEGKVHLVSPGALYQRTLMTQEEALKQASTWFRQGDPIERGPESGGPPPIPWSDIEAVLRYFENTKGSVMDPHIAKIREWYDVVDDIPF